MKKSIILFALIGVGVGIASAQTTGTAGTPDPWAQLSFLVGSWVGIGTGSPGEASGGTTFSFELQKNVLVRKNWAKFPPKPGEKAGATHEDLVYIYPSTGETPFKAIYFDSEGHVIPYAASFPQKPNAVVFESEPGPPGPRYRLEYELNTDGILKNVFSVAPPGQDFKPYMQGLLKKTR
jgi:hypothetical protein